MPKRIPDAKECILTAAKEVLFEKGYEKLALREVARRCGVAVGTIYNYFPGKEVLVASVMAGDWLASLAAVRQALAAASDVESGVRLVYEAISAYSNLYEPIWSAYNGALPSFGARHTMLRGQLADLFAGLLARLKRDQDAGLCPLLAEIVLACAVQKDIGYPVLREAVGRLFP